MITRYTYGDITWIDVDKPTREDINLLGEEFSLHPILRDDLLTASLRQKVDSYENCIYLILHFPVPHHERAHAVHEVDFIVGKNFLITTRYDALDPLHYFAKAFEVNAILEKNPPNEHAGFILFFMLRKLYESTSIALSLIGERIGHAEEKIFSGHEYHMVKELSLIQRDVLLYHRALRNHRSMLNSFANESVAFFGEDYRHWAHELSTEYLKVEEKLEDRKEMLVALRGTNDSLLAGKTSTAMRSLTTLSLPVFVATLTAGIFSMRPEFMPLVGHFYGFWLILALILAVGLLTGVALRYYRKYND